MARISTKKNTEVKVAVDAKEVSKKSIIRPRITEKATDLSHKSNAYVFDVHQNATKPQVKKAISDIYKVKVVKVAMVHIPSKEVYVRGKKGRTNQGKKAYVYLKEGDKIEFV